MTIKAEVQGAILDLAYRGYSASQILDKLSRTPKYQELGLPNIRTVQRRVDIARKKDTSGTWSLGDTDAADAPAIFKVLVELVTATQGRITAVTRSEAGWIATISRAVPDLPAWEIYVLARNYLKREETGTATSDLDAYLAFGQWRATKDNPTPFNGYWHAVHKGYITVPDYIQDQAKQLAELEATWAELHPGLARKIAELEATNDEKGE